MATYQWSTMSRQRPPKSAAYVDPDETISDVSDDDRTIADIGEGDNGDEPVIVQTPTKKCAITYIMNDDENDNVKMSDMAQHYIGSTKAKPILIDNKDGGDNVVAAVPAPRVYHLQPRIKTEPMDDTVVKIKKELDPVTDAKLSSVLYGAQLDGFPLMPPLSPKEEGKSEQEQAGEKDKMEPVAVAEELPPQEEPAPDSPKSHFGDVDLDGIDLDAVLQDSLSQPGLFSMDNINTVDNMDSMGSMQTSQDGTSFSFPPPTKDNPPVPSCESQFTALGANWPENLMAGPVKENEALPAVTADAATDSSSPLGAKATSVAEDTTTLVGTPEPDDKGKNLAVDGYKASPVAASNFEVLFGAAEKAPNQDKATSADKDKDNGTDTDTNADKTTQPDTGTAPNNKTKGNVATKATPTPAPTSSSSGKESSNNANTDKATVTENKVPLGKDVSKDKTVSKEKAVDTSVATEVEKGSAKDNDNRQGYAPKVATARDDPLDDTVDADSIPATSVPDDASKSTKTIAAERKDVTRENVKDADKSKESAPIVEMVPDVDAGPSTPASVPVPPGETDNTPETDKATKEADLAKAPAADMEADMEPVVVAGPSTASFPSPLAQPETSPEDAVATQLASALCPEPEPALLEQQESPFGEPQQEPDGAPLGGGQEDPEPMDVDPPAEVGADNEESIFVDRHPEPEAGRDADQENLELDIEDIENGFSLEGPGYAWKEVDAMLQGRAIRVLEESVSIGIDLGHKVINTLNNSPHDSRIHATRWKKEFASICEANDNFRVLVGVSGTTGAGKTTLINALLDKEELLPSGSDGAATATVCRVHQAKEPDAPPFRAVVSFKNKKGMQKWLKPIMDDVADYYAWKDAQDEKRRKRRALKGLDSDDDSDDDESEEEDSDSGSESDDDGNAEDDDYVPDGETAEQRKEREWRKQEKEEKQTAKVAKRREKEKKRWEKAAKKAREEEEDSYDVQSITDKLLCVQAIFRRGLDHLKGWTVDDLLDEDKFPIVKLVGQTKTVISEDLDSFSDAIKPYLDSTPIPDNYDFDDFDENENGEEDEEQEEEEEDEDEDEYEGEGGGGGEDDGDSEDSEDRSDAEDDDENIECTVDRLMWPIVTHVDIYMKDAPLLQNGVVLADLPGLADANEDRAAIAKACFEDLDITLIVTPAIRASDDATAASLISDNEEVHLRLTNRMNKRAFCVVSSKIDDMNSWETYIQKTVKPEKGSLLAYHGLIYDDLRSQLKLVNDQLRVMDDKIQEMKTEIEIEEFSQSPGAKDGVRALNLELAAARTFLPEIIERRDSLEVWLEYYKELMFFRAIEYRNKKVRHNVQETFLRKTVGAQANAEKAKAKKKGKGKKAAEGDQADPQADAPVDPATGVATDATVPDNVEPPKKPKEPGLIDVLPISGGAYWKIRKNDKKRGFPTDAFTGVPAVRAWIRASTIPMRRTHATSLLMRLSVLLHQLKTGFGEPSSAPSEAVDEAPSSPSANADTETETDTEQPATAPMQVQASQVVENPAEEVRKILDRFRQVLKGNLNSCGHRLEAQVMGCNPMAEASFNQPAVAPAGAGDPDAQGKGGAVIAKPARRPRFNTGCRKHVITSVVQWQFRNIRKDDPSQGKPIRKQKMVKGGGHQADEARFESTWLKGVKGNIVRMPWTTHAAIIRRNGGPYFSTGKIRGAYRWMHGMTQLVLADVVSHWETSLHGRLPRETEAARGVLMDAWGRAFSRLRVRLPQFYSGESEAHLRQHLSALLAIRDCCVDASQRAMQDVARQSKTVGFLVENILEKGWKTAFKKASEMSGKGVFNSRQSFMEAHAEKKTSGLVKKAMQSMDTEYRMNVKKFRETLDEICEEGLVQVEHQVMAMLQRVGNEGDAALANRTPLDKLARDIQGFIFQWEGDWKAPDVCTQMDVDVSAVNDGISGIDEASAAIPTEYLPEPANQPALEELLPDLHSINEDEGGDDENDALNADLTVIPGSKPKRGAKRKAGDDGGKGKTPAKKRKPAAPKKPAAKGATRGGRGGGKAAAGKATASKAGGGKGSRGGKEGGRGGRGGGRGRGKT